MRALEAMRSELARWQAVEAEYCKDGVVMAHCRYRYQEAVRECRALWEAIQTWERLGIGKTSSIKQGGL